MSKKGKYFEYDMISGPVSACFMTKNGKSVVLFGDAHFSIANMCLPCREEKDGCITIDKFLEKVFTESKLSVDFFMETPYVSKESDVQHIFEQEQRIGEIIGNLMDKFGQCLVSKKSKECKKMHPNTRMHYIDLRFGETYVMTFEKLYSITSFLAKDIGVMKNIARNNQFDIDSPFIYAESSISKYSKKFAEQIRTGYLFDMMKIILKSRKEYYDYIKLFWTSEDFNNDITKILGKDLVNKMYPKNQETTYTKNKRVIKAHRIKKQLDAIVSDELRNYVIAYIESLFEDFLKNFDFRQFSHVEEYFNINTQNQKIKKMNSSGLHKYFTNAAKVLDELDYLFLDTGVYLVDAYTIARMVKYYEKTDTIIAYAGDMHIGHYKMFFKEFIQMNVENEINQSMFYKYSQDADSQYDNRCIIAKENKPFKLHWA
jgi:hypothetical protein